MASELKRLFSAQADEIEELTGTEKAQALLAFGSFLIGRAITVTSDVITRSELDDQGVLDLAKKHDVEASVAWTKLKAATEPVE